jgi:cyclophilin family peptidyl-prolyl cis-trans isomerase
MNKKIYIVGFAIILLLGFFVINNRSNSKETTMSDNTQQAATQSGVVGTPTMVIDVNKTYTAVLNTSEGEIKIHLNAKETPITANNFVYLAQKKFYDGTIFHRVINGFMIQGGDPKGDGTGGPGYRFNDEPFTGEYKRGTIAMANAGPNTNGSQFFIMHKDYGLPHDYVIFGNVTVGLEVVDKIATAPVSEGMFGENSTPVKPVKVESVTIIEE